MCGIAGIVNFGGEPVDRSDVERMTRALAHRGPDGEGIWVDGPVGFGHRRLAIRDLGEGGRQPMHDASGAATVTFNGEIYNDRSLRAALVREAGTRFRSSCDAEVVAPGYLAWDLGLFDRLEGMFAIALWDADRRRLVLARDPAGIKPLYYARVGRSIRFASEVKGLLALADQPRRLSPADLHVFLAAGHPGPARSLVEGIEQVPPGAVLIADADGVRLHRYWEPRRRPEIRDLGTALEAFAPLWRKTVADLLISDVPVGLLLSGGIDSALIAAELRGRPEIPAFTARFASAGHDETSAAETVARFAGLKHVVAPVDAGHDAEATFRAVVHHFDGQVADSSAFAFYGICREARRHVPVLLSGDGADEFFGGYETYRASRLAGPLGAIVPRGTARMASRALARQATGSAAAVPMAAKLARLMAGIAVAPPGQAHVQWRRYLMADRVDALYGPELRPLAAADPLADYAQALAAAPGGLVDRCLTADQAYYLPGDMLMKADAMSMAHSLEIRVPFLERPIMELANRLDARLLTPMGGPDKRVLRAALERTGIGSAIARRRKHGFNVPAADLLRDGLAGLGARLLDRDADRLLPYLRPEGVRQLWREHQAGSADHGYVLWTLLTLAVWTSQLGP